MLGKRVYIIYNKNTFLVSVHLCGRPSCHNRQPGLRPDSDDVGSGPVPGLRVVVIVVPVVPVQAGGVDQGGQGQSHLPIPSQVWKVQTRRVGYMSPNGTKGRTECGQVKNDAHKLTNYIFTSPFSNYLRGSVFIFH